MSDKAPIPGVGEADPFCTIEFHIQLSSGTTIYHTADCGVGVEIGALKHDLKEFFKLDVSDQVWYYKDDKLEDHQLLDGYGIDGKDNIKILVKKRS